MYINGKNIEGKGKPFDIVCPATMKVAATINAATTEQAEEALQAAKNAFRGWSKMSLNERISWMKKLRDICLAHEEELSELAAQEGGKNYSDAHGQVKAFANYMDFYAEEAKRVYDIGLPDYNAHRDSYHLVMRRPIGVVVDHLPWNSPLNLMGVKLAPVLASGCTCVIKPSTSTPLTALRVAELAEEIEFPAGVFNVVTGPSSEIGKYLNGSRIPAMISLVGSSEVGCQIVNESSNSIKRYSFELGGNAPCIIMPDTDLEEVVPWIVRKKIIYSGQACSNINRIYVHRDIHDRFISLLEKEARKVEVNWGPETPKAMGPLINVRTRDRLLKLIRETVEEGAELIYGGKPQDLPEHLKDGAFLLPTILDKVTDDMKIARQELFSAIFTILTFDDIDDAIRRSNQTETGLSSYVFTHDARIMCKCAEELDFGEVNINKPDLDVNHPHIGIKQSGVSCDRSFLSLRDYYYNRRCSMKP